MQPSKIAVIPQGFAKFVNFVKASDLAFNEQAPWSPAHILETTFNKCHAFFEKMAASYPMTFDDLNTLDQDLTKLLETNQSLRARLEIALQIYQIPLTSNLTGLDTDRFLNGATAMIAEEYENSSFAKNPDDPNFDDYQNLLEHIENSIRGLLIADTFSHETKGGRDFFAFVRYMDQISDDFCDATEMFFVKKVVNSSPNANTTKDDRDRKTDVLKPLNESGQLKPLKLFPQN